MVLFIIIYALVYGFQTFLNFLSTIIFDCKLQLKSLKIDLYFTECL